MIAPLPSTLRVALVHDWLNQYGGAERVLETLKTLFPAAPVYTAMVDYAAMPPEYATWDIRPSFLDAWPGVKRRHQVFLPFYPLAFDRLAIAPCDLILSNKSGICHGVHKPSGSRHLCYCLTPTRFVWDFAGYVEHEGTGRLARTLVPPLLGWLQAWDYQAAQQVDAFAAISTTVQARISRYYGRDSVIIHPPTDVSLFTPSDEQDDYYLIVSRLVPYKRVDLAVQAFTRLGRRLVIIGDGRDRARLEALAGPTVEFWGRRPDPEVRRAMARCQAFVFPGLEDFGLTPVEVQASGRPVIAYAGGGALDTVIPGLTGALFSPQTADALADVVAAFDPSAYDPALCRRNAERFDTPVFRCKLARFIGLET